MSLTIDTVEVTNFRNYAQFDLSLAPGLTILVGPNAIGKTNLVEAIQLLTETSSFRNPVWSELIRWGGQETKISLHAEDGERRYDVEMRVNAAGRRSFTVNGKPKKTSVSVAGTIPCVLFTPDDLRIVKDSAERRRAALDGIGVQLSETYGRLKSEYERVVRQRNALLKQENVSDDLLAPWDERLVALGAKLSLHRQGLFTRVREAAGEIYAGLAEERLEATYVPSWERDGVAEPGQTPSEALEMQMNARRGDERVRGTTLVGPHRDEIVFLLDGKNARTFASQGQQRTVALAWKLAEVRVINDVSGKRPVLLLDDVMSELDEQRRSALTALVGESAQTVITTTNLDYFGETMLSSAKVVALGG